MKLLFRVPEPLNDREIQKWLNLLEYTYGSWTSVASMLGVGYLTILKWRRDHVAPDHWWRRSLYRSLVEIGLHHLTGNRHKYKRRIEAVTERLAEMPTNHFNQGRFMKFLPTWRN